MANDKPTPDQMRNMSDDQIVNLIARVVEAVRPPAPPPPLTEEEQFAQIQKMAEERPLLREVAHGRVKSRSGATFIPRVVCSREYPKGRVVELLEYTHPAGIDIPQDQGGLAPNGIGVKTRNGSGLALESPQYKHWKYTTFWRRDLAEYVGGDAALLPSPIPPAAPQDKAAE